MCPSWHKAGRDGQMARDSCWNYRAEEAAPAHVGLWSRYVKEQWLDLGLNASEEEAPASAPGVRDPRGQGSKQEHVCRMLE